MSLYRTSNKSTSLSVTLAIHPRLMHRKSPVTLESGQGDLRWHAGDIHRGLEMVVLCRLTQ